MPGKSPVASIPKLSRASTPQRSLSQQSHVLESTTPLTPRTPQEAGTLPNIGDQVTEKVKDNKSASGALPGLKSQLGESSEQSRRKGSPPLRKGSPPLRKGSPPLRKGSPPLRKGSPPLRKGSPPLRKGSPPLKKDSPRNKQRMEMSRSDQTALTEVDGRRMSMVKYEGDDSMNLTSESSTTLGALSIPNAGYILGTRLYEQRHNFQNVLGSNPDLTQENSYTSQMRGTPLALEGSNVQAAPPLTRDMVKTLNNFSHSVALQPIPTTSLVASNEGKAEPNIPYQQIPGPSTHPASSRTEYQMESAAGVRSEGTAPYLGPASERSAKVRPVSVTSGVSEGMSFEAPDDNAESESTGEYEMTIPETDPGNEDVAQITEERESSGTMGEKDERQFVEEECEEHMTRTEEMEDVMDEVMRPQAKSGEEELEFEDYVLEDGRKSVELEGEIEMELEDNSPETVEEMSSKQEPNVGDEADTEVDDFERPVEEEDEESFERGATPNSNTTEYLRDDLSSTSLHRPDSRIWIDETLDPEFNALTLASPRSYNDDDECGELILKNEIKDAFDTPYLRDYSKTPTGETDSESDTEYEFCNESEDEISVAHHRSDDDDDGNTAN